MFVVERQTHRPWVEVAWVVFAAILALLVVALSTPSAGFAEPREEPQRVYIVSPWTGIFRATEYPGAPPFVEVGSQVQPGTTVAVIEDFMVAERPMSFVVPAGVSGIIHRVLVDDGQVVAVGQPLFEVIPRDEMASVR